MFTTPCFIRKNTPELREKLEALGYKVLFSARNGYGDGLHAILGFVYGEAYKDGIDCGENEDLFLALAALRDDTDENQWFTDGKTWFKCQYEDIKQEAEEAKACNYFGSYCYHSHKATVEELIEHFKK